MGTIEIVLLIAIGIVILVGLYSIFFSKKVKEKLAKKKDKKKNKKGRAKVNDDTKVSGEKKVEQAIKSNKKPDEPQKQEAPPIVTPAEPELEKKKSQPFKIIRKQSEVKINKKALKNGSRNPSVTKVFENGKRVDETPQETVKSATTNSVKDEKKIVSPIETVEEDVGDFGFREPKFLEVNTQDEFRINPPQGLPNRAPIIEDRTNFTSRLKVSSDNNLSGVSIVGTQKVVEKAESQTKEIEQKTNDLVEDVRKKLLGEKVRIDTSFGFPHNMAGMQSGTTKTKKSAKEKLKNIDAETLIIVDAISNPKHKK